MQFKKLKTVLLESLFNPKDKTALGALRFALETNNVDYWLIKATELINEARQQYIKTLRQDQEKLKEAISLILMARAKLIETEFVRKPDDPKTRD